MIKFNRTLTNQKKLAVIFYFIGTFRRMVIFFGHVVALMINAGLANIS